MVETRENPMGCEDNSKDVIFPGVFFCFVSFSMKEGESWLV